MPTPKNKITYRKTPIPCLDHGGLTHIKHTDRLINRMKLSYNCRSFGGDGYFRKNIFGGQLIWGDRLFTMKNKNSMSNMKHMFIFAHVKKNAVAYGKTHKLKPSKWIASIVWNTNKNNNGKKIVGTDLDDAYWTIAYKKGIISEKTYNHGLRINKKSLCLAALATLGSDKTYQDIKHGVLTGDITIVKGDDNLKLIYQSIRHTCFNYMITLSKMLGDDFVCYKTDCIYYVSTKKNIKMVAEFFESKGLDTKMMMKMPSKVEEKYK